VRAKEAGLKFHLKIEGMIPETVQTDPTRLRQILINLAGNAVKFTEEGWVRLVAKLIDPPDSPNPRMRYEVIDTGIGMTQEQIKQLFKPFMQVDSSLTRRFGGTGLGLTISQRLAKALGGEITVDSMPGRGSLFALTLPTGSLKGVKLTQDVTEALGGTAPTEARPSTGSAIRLKGHILLAEDGPDNRQLLSAYLEKAGAKVTVAENGRIAYEKVVETMHEGEGGYDLVLMDMQMPELDGYGATAKLRSVGFQKPIVALTANAMSTDRAKCVRAGCTDYLSKPVKRDDLLKTVQRYLQAGEAAASAEASERAAVEAAPKESPKDDLLSKFRPEYVAKLPQEVTRLVTYAVSGRYEDLDQVAHNLAGTAGMFGFMDISKSAAALMKDLKADAGRETIELGVQGLVELIRQVPGYDRSKEDKG
jgi:CheY-like chemotaxis protein